MMDGVTVSVVITTFNRFSFLEQAIDSVAFQKGIPKIQIIVVDDGSTDSTNEFLDSSEKSGAITVIKSDHQGPGVNRRLGFTNATGDYIIFMDDDDYYTDQYFMFKAVRSLKENPDASVVFFNTEQLIQSDNSVLQDQKFNEKGYFSSEIMLSDFMVGKAKPMSTFPAVFRMKKLVDAGFKDMVTLNDTQIYLRSFLSGGAVYQPDTIGVYRIHGGSISNALSTQFIIQNLDEKYEVYHLLPPSINDDKWLRQQVWITIYYYLTSSSEVKLQPIVKWLLRLPTSVKMNLYVRIFILRIRFFLFGH